MQSGGQLYDHTTPKFKGEHCRLECDNILCMVGGNGGSEGVVREGGTTVSKETNRSKN